MTEAENGTQQTEQSQDKHDQRDTSLAKRVMSVTGYVMLISSVSLFGFIAYQSTIIGTPTKDNEQELFVWVLQNFTDDILIFFGAIFLSIVGIRLLGAAGKGVPTVIPPDDRDLLEPLIKAANAPAINQYVILSSLTGFTGTFQKIGFSGLPLATVSLTLIFSALSFLDGDFLELAKLTLGAFIGSFVQKSTGVGKIASLKTPD